MNKIPKCLSKYWLRWTQERCQTKNKNKKNQPSLGFYPGTVLHKANPGLNLRVLAGKSNLQVLVLPRKANPSTSWFPGRKKTNNSIKGVKGNNSSASPHY